MNVKEFYAELEALYPSRLSAPWDHDGLMVCADPQREVRRVLVSLDGTLAAVRYAAAHGFDLLLTHHPLLFRGIKQMTQEDLGGRRAFAAIDGGVSVISLHTRLDAGEGGVNDLLAGLLDLIDVRPFGNEECPTLGRIGEVPVFNLLDSSYFYPIVKEKLKCEAMMTATAGPIYHVAVCGGAGDDLLDAAKAAGADTFVTGEMGYNRMEDAAEMGMTVVVAGHYATERPVCERLAELARNIAGAEVLIYESNPVTCHRNR